MFQIAKDDQIQPIVYVSHKFSEPATRWSVIERECYGCYWSVYSTQYYLRCKEFVLQTDHRNLVWMESSEVPKIIRWCIFLQSFTFQVEHIPGAYNRIADALSRLYLLTDIKMAQLSSAHGGRAGHNGVERTYALIKDMYVDNEITYDDVRTFVKGCSVCQKFRSSNQPTLPAITKTLNAQSNRSVIACDTLSVAPDSFGNRYILVIINLRAFIPCCRQGSTHHGYLHISILLVLWVI